MHMRLFAGIIILAAMGAAFGIITTRVARRFGRGSIVACWFLGALALGSAWAFRSLHIQRSIGPDRISAPGLYAILIVSALVVLSVPSAAIWHGAATDSSVDDLRHGAVAMGWTVLGFLLAILISALLDIVGVSFVPIR